jgi:hypothetical protein
LGTSAMPNTSTCPSASIDCAAVGAVPSGPTPGRGRKLAGDLTADIRFFDDAGEVVSRVEGLHLGGRAGSRSAARSRATPRVAHEVAWSPEEGAPLSPRRRVRRVVSSPIVAESGRAWPEAGRGAIPAFPCVRATPISSRATGSSASIPSSPRLQRLYRELLNSGEMPVRGVLHLWSLDEEGPLTGSS